MRSKSLFKKIGLFCIAFVICCFALSCGQPMTNEQIIAEKDKCVKANMDYKIIQNGWNWDVLNVVCSNKK